jgi:hypothetical protein
MKGAGDCLQPSQREGESTGTTVLGKGASVCGNETQIWGYRHDGDHA